MGKYAPNAAKFAAKIEDVGVMKLVPRRSEIPY